MKIINFYGVPGSGKSTLAAELFVYMKKKEINVEIASEYAKDCIYQERYTTIQDQIYLLAKMNHKLQIFKKAKLDYVICDSPLLLNIMYKQHQYMMNYLNDKIFSNFCIELNNTYNRLNFFITKDSTINYQIIGRIESEEESNRYINQLKNILDNNNEKYISVINSKTFNIEQLYTYIKNNNSFIYSK